MKENNNISKSIRSLRERFKMDPPEDIWNKIEVELERQRALKYRQRGNRFKLLSLILALLLFSIITFNYFAPDKSKTPGSSSNINEYSKVGNDGQSYSKIGSEKNLWGIQHNISTTSSNYQKSDNLKQNTKSTEENYSEDKTVFLNILPKEQTVIENHKLEKMESDVLNSTATIPVNNESSIVSNAIEYNISKENNYQSLIAKEGFESKPVDENNAVETISIHLDSTQNTFNKDSILHNTENKISLWTASIFYGPNAYAVNRLKILNLQYADKIKSYTQLSIPNYSFNSGASLGYDFSKRWSLSIGGIYSTIAYTSIYPMINAGIGSDNLYHYKYHSSCGTIEIPNEPNVVLNANSVMQTSITCAQVIKIASLPLLVKYNIAMNRFSFYINTGFAADFIMEEVANISTDADKYTVINHISGLRKTNYSYILKAGIDYKINTGMSIFMEPSFTTSVTPIMQNSYFECYPYSIGINTGMSFHF
jgi:hypothetical protein